jgi:hypothetical protein
MFLLIGDSNLRQTFLAYKDRLLTEVGLEIDFEQATSNEAIKICLEKEREVTPDLFYISSILNEISKNTGKGKPTEGIIKTVTEDQNVVINSFAGKVENTNRLYLQCYPMLRQDPKWMEEKLLQIKFYMKEQHTMYSPVNVILVGEPIIEATDLQSDKTHLNESGQAKFFEKIKADLLEGKKEIDRFKEFGTDWATQDLSQKLSQKTPKTAKKRMRTEEMEIEDDTPVNTPKKKKEDETIMGMLRSFMEEIKEDRKQTKKKTEEIVESIDKLKESEIEIWQEVKSLKGKSKEDKIFTATLREDLDAVENENMRNIVIVKKMKTKERTTTDKSEMSSLVQKEARKLVTDILGDESSIAFITLLFMGKDGLKVKEGQLPPFKIVFKTKEKGIEFKEKAVAKSKNIMDPLNKTYITNQQCLATRIRSNLMWGCADKVKNEKKGIDSWVNQGLNKPTLQVKGEERTQRSYTFVGAMEKYEDKLDDKTKDEATKLAKRFFEGQIEKIFIVIKD